MRRISLLLIILTPLLNFSQTQNKQTFTVSGKIIDASTKKPLEDATIIFKNKDSNTIKCGTITNARGNFSIDVEEGNYNAFAEFISYKTKNINISTINRNLNIGTIALEVDTEFLDEVEIIGEKKAIEFKPNKIVFHVDKDIAAAGGVATDILNNIPSVSVDPNGGITVQGQGNVQVMINGKTSSLTKAEALKSLPAGAIEDIVVLANPGAKYNSAALSVINIILKKGKDEGLNASLTASGGYKDYSGGLFTINNKDKNVNFYINSSYNQSTPVTQSMLENEYFENNNTTAFLNENSLFKNKKNVFYGTVGAEFYLSKKSTLNTSINYINANSNSNTLTTSEIFDTSLNTIELNDRKHIGGFDNEMVEFIADFSHNFKKEGETLSTSVSYSKDKDKFDNTITNSNTNFSDENYIEENKATNTSVGFEYSNPVSENSTYYIGFKGDYFKLPFKYTNTTTINSIDYNEKVSAAYIEFENQSEKFYFGIGLRAEFIEMKADYLNLNNSQKNNFDKLLPSALLEYNLSDTKNVSLSFSQKMFTPGYEQLRPFEEKFSEISSYIGNPTLKPIYIDSFNLSFSSSGNKFSFFPSIYYQIFKDYWQNITYETGEQLNGVNKIITTPVNLGKVNYYGININATYKASNILSFTSNLNIYNFDQTGTYSIINNANKTIVLDYNNNSINGSFSLFTQLKIPNVFDFQINGKHTLKSVGPYSTRKAYTYASTAIKKDLFDNDASLSLRVDDLFLSNKTDRNRYDTNYFSKSLIKNKYRTILLSFTYRFNQSKKDRVIDFGKKDIKPNY
ncbi:outer membrane receptor protein involved in Fe transport [Lutibacter oceani]|uniref:Outer membrane receptor protein involved in Fe transport n=1 Tax=Lutibacter oceani TaxID=1853311 RepID=A0A3D9RV64_9FLAO|nr:outer membrane beta-barrel protein [Lutibacter oceani]REE81641.1 outer membrane receptor protein involved in Fe transport [Lutibacter oceani]